MKLSRLHSRYQPQLEAERYIEALNLPSDINCFILIEPGFGYLISALQKNHPNSKVIALHVDSSFSEGGVVDVPAWFPGSEMGVQEFLETAVPEAATIRLIEWRPSLLAYGEKYLDLVRESTEFIKRADASRRTGAVFGGRWIRNFFRNLSLVRTCLLYRVMDMPLVITGSGPALEAALPKILAAREGIFVLAASSSLPALAAGGITPDMVISTDGGGWALMHLYACFRAAQGTTRGNMLAFGLTAALPSQCSQLPLLPLSDGSLWQNLVLSGAGIPSVMIPQRGTVTASALDLALALTGGDIFLAGMDLSVQDIRSHARPYGFDHLFFGTASRLRPVYSQYFTRSGDIKAGGSHDVYAAWFKSRIASWPKRIFSLGGNHAAFESTLPGSDLKRGGDHCLSDHFKTITPVLARENACDCALDTLITALDDTQHSGALRDELAPLLFPAQPDVSPTDIAQALRMYGMLPHNMRKHNVSPYNVRKHDG